MMRGRKGDLAVTLLVFMIVVLIAVALFSFIRSSGGGEAMFGDMHVAESAIAREDAARFNLLEAGKRSSVLAYQELAGSLIKQLSEGVISAEGADSLFIAKLGEKIKADSIFGGKTLAIAVDGQRNSFNASLKNVIYIVPTKIANEDTNALSVGVSYQTDLVVKWDLRNEGLHGFGEVADAGKSCVGLGTNAGIEGCLRGKLFNFDVKVEDRDMGKNIVLTTKREYLINGAFKRVEFSYVQGK